MLSLSRSLRCALALSLLMGSAAYAADAPKAAKPMPSRVAPVLTLSVDRGEPMTLQAPASSVFIANPEIADVQVMSPTSIMVFGKRIGETTLMATDNAGKTLLHRTVVVTQGLADLRAALRAVIPNNKIRVEAVPNGIVLTGEASDPSVIEDARRLALRYVPKDSGEVINRIKVKGSNQIHIRVRFAEVSRAVNKAFGINWGALAEAGGVTFGLASGSELIPSDPTKSIPTFPQANIGSAALNRIRPPVGGGNYADILSFGVDRVNGMIDALAQDGLITVLAEPNLTAMSGETASFLAGGEFPIPVPQSNNAVTIDWKTYGVSLAFTPTLIGEDRINMHVRPEVSQLSDAGAVTLNSITVPALTTRRAETTIELASGQSFAIGGLLNNSQNQAVEKYPFLGDVPVLGALFRSTSFQNNESELVIIITPYIVKPVSEGRLALPTDGYSAPSDKDRLLNFRTSNSDPNARPLSGEPLARPEAPLSELPPVSAAPVAPVLQQGAPAAEPVVPSPPTPVPEKKAALPPSKPMAVAQPLANPAGPGGFTLE